MCGLAGFSGFKNNRVLANEANVIQQHRGPDAQSVWTDEFVALAHQRLSIIDVGDRSNQPFRKEEWLIVFNGEIYNYKELKELLLIENSSLQFITESDTEVLLELFRNKGVDALSLIKGMFAFAIYNTKLHQLYLARDPFGIKPLYFYQLDNCFAFASELKTLLQIPTLNKEIDSVSLLASINYNWIPGNNSIFRTIKKVTPGFCITIDLKSSIIKEKCFFKLSPKVKFSDTFVSTMVQKQIIRQSVQRHMVADVEIGVFLSGGLDSSLLTSIATEYNSSIQSFTIKTKKDDKKAEKTPDDHHYAKKVASLLKIPLNDIALDNTAILEFFNLIYHLDEPIGDPAAINTYLICKKAREMGIKVLLSGMGADEIFMGYRRHQAMMYKKLYNRIPQILQGTIKRTINNIPVRVNKRGVRIVRMAKRFLKFCSQPDELAYMLSYSYYDYEQLQKLFNQNITEEYRELRRQHQEWFNTYYDSDIINKMCYTDIHMFMQGLNLAYTDKASMAASVEVRVPFVDKDVIVTAMKTDSDLKYKKRKQKYILKKIAEDYLPKYIVHRKKASFAMPIRSWVNTELVPLINELLSKESVEKRGIFNYDEVKKIIEDDRLGKADNAYQIYQLLTVEAWFRIFIDNNFSIQNENCHTREKSTTIPKLATTL